MSDLFFEVPSEALIFLIALAVFFLTASLLSRYGRKQRQETYNRTPIEIPAEPRKFEPVKRRKFKPARKLFDITNIGHQLEAVSSAPFERQKILNFSEHKVFRIVENLLFAECKDCRLFAQVSLGEILMSPDANAHRSINSKRLDMLIVDKAGWPVLAIEYQGAGHYQDNVIGRDAVKKEALRKADIKFLEIGKDDSDEQIELYVRDKLGLKTQLAEIANSTKKNNLRVVAGA